MDALKVEFNFCQYFFKIQNITLLAFFLLVSTRSLLVETICDPHNHNWQEKNVRKILVHPKLSLDVSHNTINSPPPNPTPKIYVFEILSVLDTG